LEDVYPNLEAEVIRQLGEDVGGALLTGRSRAEVQLTADRLLLRETIRSPRT
jgi:argininosuccinate lyase